jgi:hypothetical protein
MKIVHWVEKGLRSGLGHTATHISAAERALGIDSILVDCNDEADWHNADDADVYVVHLFLPLKRIYDKTPKVWVAHGTPETMFEGAYLETTKGQYGPADGWMLSQWWLQNADVTVTFWPRHEAIWKSLSDKHTRVEGVPMGADLEFWKPVQSGGKFAGEPSVFSAENCYTLKWPWDLLVAWGWVARELPESKLHVAYVPMDQSRFWGSLINRNGAGFHSYMTHRAFSHEELRNAFNSTDYYCGLVRYGDHNYISLQANASGAKTISYPGNPYSDYWVDFGDQRILAQQLGAILRGDAEPRVKSPVVSIQRTAERMKEIYLSLAKDAPTGLPQPKQQKKKVITPETSMATMTIQ